TSFTANQARYGPVELCTKDVWGRNTNFGVPIDARPASRPYGGRYDGPYFTSNPFNTYTAYDSRFRNPLFSQNKPIFFGGGEASWREIDSALY
ncbi:MAG: hypothetical protein NC912_06600, partial [Candidatus Omnitrophica bacterium]|nr:hypothetical protein [Candidatus Omnitrophota bacterium]